MGRLKTAGVFLVSRRTRQGLARSCCPIVEQEESRGPRRKQASQAFLRPGV